jgi:MFS family permease
MQLLNIFIGAALLLFGRRLFWLFVACVGFVVGAKLATDALGHQQPEWLILLIALGVGLLGAIVSMFLQRVAVGIAGFFAGGYLLSTLALGMKYQGYDWIAFVFGGVLGAILTVVLLDPALIVLSALVGATTISQSFSLQPSTSTILFVVLLIFGIAVQTGQYARQTKSRRQQDFK